MKFPPHCIVEVGQMTEWGISGGGLTGVVFETEQCFGVQIPRPFLFFVAFLKWHHHQVAISGKYAGNVYVFVSQIMNCSSWSNIILTKWYYFSEEWWDSFLQNSPSESRTESGSESMCVPILQIFLDYVIYIVCRFVRGIKIDSV